MLNRTEKDLEKLARDAEKTWFNPYRDLGVSLRATMLEAVKVAYSMGLMDLKDKKRTGKQNNSLHLYCSWVADALNEKGLTVQQVLQHSMEINWTTDRVKDLVWRLAQKGLLGKESTTELDRHEPKKIHEHVIRFLAKAAPSVGFIDWPHLEVPDPPEPEYPVRDDSKEIQF